MNLFTRNNPYYHLLKYLLFLLKNTLYIYIYIYIYIERERERERAVCLSVCLSCLHIRSYSSVCLAIYNFTSVPIFLSVISLSFCLPVSMFIHLPSLIHYFWLPQFLDAIFLQYCYLSFFAAEIDTQTVNAKVVMVLLCLYTTWIYIE